jgi:deoxyribodipyrimidine photo-lyase
MAHETTVPNLRVRTFNSLPLRSDQPWVLYWVTAFRRTRYNFALQYARDRATELQKPLVILEALQLGYRWASERFHGFVIDGMVDNQAACRRSNALYYPYVEPFRGAASGLIEALARSACLVVTDDFPCFFHPRMLQSIAPKLPCRLDLVDSNCLMPLAASQLRTFTVAHSYRRFMQKELPGHLSEMPEALPLGDPQKVGSDRQRLPKLKSLPATITDRWPAADLKQLRSPDGLSGLYLDHEVRPTSLKGGAGAADSLLSSFLQQRLENYEHDRNEPDETGSSELSPYLHFGHISAHEIFHRLMEGLHWKVSYIKKPNGKVNGFWGVDPNAEAFLDQLCTWREIGFNMCWTQPDNYYRYSSLPAWARQTLEEHESDVRTYLYSLGQLEAAQTHDPIWNAAQCQLVREGRIHNYLRMLWGKKILQWTPSARHALKVMIELNNKYALDGRNPNSYSGIFWVLGRYDRAWGPERPIFGKIRYMTSENTAKKHALGDYLKRYH